MVDFVIQGPISYKSIAFWQLDLLLLKNQVLDYQWFYFIPFHHYYLHATNNALDYQILGVTKLLWVGRKLQQMNKAELVNIV